ncbi:hypothetical protein BRC81_00245 [Halobacteriales archaeon QS_1_68_20]|nr:MAG: hypothetical protein BRC81_00245 [Halobacteriales archaeon QS_1_68_20]
MSDGGLDTSRVSVKTYVPAYQREVWADHADRLGMSQSEFVRTMVQAGRRDFQVDPGKPGSTDDTPGVEGLEDRILGALEAEGVLDFDELVGTLSADLEDRLDEAMEKLQAENRVQYRGREGGYAVVDE